jgi:hypothetical protein
MTSSLSREQDPAGDITPNFDVFLLGKKDVAKAAKATRNPYFTLIWEHEIVERRSTKILIIFTIFYQKCTIVNIRLD